MSCYQFAINRYKGSGEFKSIKDLLQSLRRKFFVSGPMEQRIIDDFRPLKDPGKPGRPMTPRRKYYKLRSHDTVTIWEEF